MAFTVCFEPAEGIRTVVVSEEMNVQDVHEFLGALWEYPGVEPGVGVIWDLRGLAPQGPALTGLDVRSLAQDPGRRWARLGQGRLAVVTARGVDFGLARMFSSLMEPVAPARVRAFQDLTRARDWVVAEVSSPPQYSLPLKIAADNLLESRKRRIRRPYGIEKP